MLPRTGDLACGHVAEGVVRTGFVVDGLLTIGVDAKGRKTWALTPMGEQVANQMAMGAEDDAAALLDALLDAVD